MDKLWQSKIQWLNEKKTNRQINKRATYSTFFDQSGGLLKVMNTQLVKIVHIMIMLNTVEKSQGRIHKIRPFFSQKTKTFCIGYYETLINNLKRGKAQKRRKWQGDNENCGHHKFHVSPQLTRELCMDIAGGLFSFKKAVITLLLSDKTFSSLTIFSLRCEISL